MAILPASAEAIAAAAAHVLAGGVVAFPTETFYGLAVDARSRPGIDRLVALKGRERDKPIALLVANFDDLVRLSAPGAIGREARALAQAHWPGPLTLVVEAAPDLPPELIGADGGVGARVSSHPVARALVETTRCPITATSANRAGQPACTTAAEVAAVLGDELFILDGGASPGGEPSTVARVHADGRVVVLRKGAVTL